MGEPALIVFSRTSEDCSPREGEAKREDLKNVYLKVILLGEIPNICESRENSIMNPELPIT